MPSFFSALNPMSSKSGVTFRATGYPYSSTLMEQDLPDLNLSVVIPFLWSRNLSLIEGVFETFNVFYGNHFDKKGRGFGQKGVLDFTILPLLSRKLIADTYLEERKTAYFSNFLSWLIALPIETLRFSVALTCTLAMIPVLVVVGLMRWLCCCSGNTPPPPPPAAAGAGNNLLPDGDDYFPANLPLSLAFNALYLTLERLDTAGIRTRHNVRRLLQDPRNLNLIYVMERLTHVVDDRNLLQDQQWLFDFLLANRLYWTDVRVIENLDALNVINRPFVQRAQLEREVALPFFTLPQINARQSTHTASVHNSTSKSALRLQERYGFNRVPFEQKIEQSTVQLVRNYDKKLVGQRSDAEIKRSLESALDKLNSSSYQDSQSNITSANLLQYCWNALQDETQLREGVTKETAKACFYSALYEIDREYALSDSGMDNGERGSLQSCEGGSFNKLIEGMAKIHKLCEVQLINPATAGLKLPCVVRQFVKQHLAENPSALELLKEEGVSAIWAELQPKVLKVMQNDFASIYPSKGNEVNPKLLELVNAGQYTDLTQDLEKLGPNTASNPMEKSEERQLILL